MAPLFRGGFGLGGGGLFLGFALGAGGVGLLLLVGQPAQAAVAVTQATLLAHALTQVVQLAAAGVAVTLDLDLRDTRRTQRERTLHALIRHDPADHDRLLQARALLLDHHAGEHLDTLLGALDDADVDVDGVADTDHGVIGPDLGLLNRLHDCVAHGEAFHL